MSPATYDTTHVVYGKSIVTRETNLGRSSLFSLRLVKVSAAMTNQRLIKGRQYYSLDSFKNEKLRGIFLNISQHDRAKRPQKNVKITRPLKKK